MREKNVLAVSCFVVAVLLTLLFSLLGSLQIVSITFSFQSCGRRRWTYGIRVPSVEPGAPLELLFLPFRMGC